MWHCGAVVKEFLARALNRVRLPEKLSEAVFRYCVPFFLFQSLFYKAIFPFRIFSFILTADPLFRTS